MSSDDISPGTEEPSFRQEQQAQEAEAHHEAKSAPPTSENETREAADPYFDGLLFEKDKTGTTKLKSLLRGVKNAINERYSDSDNPDLMPDQLAHFYQDLNGDYNELFLRTPDASIAFIYKSLGCAYSLQPPPHAKTFSEPTKPALKTEGWIMWSTIQLLLGPDEHSAFLMEAVKQWDVKDPDTGKILPKNLPRECFPAEPDKHMVAWYEGVSERLRKEAEDEAAEKERMKKRLSRPDNAPAVQGAEDDDLDSVDSRGPALAYFRNPLYRHVDGRPAVVTSNRPLPSPRQTMVERGKDAATTVGNVIRKAASPHLWDGHGDQDRRRDRRRGSVPNARFSNSGDSNLDVPYDDRAHPRRIRHRAEEDADDSWDSDQARRKNSPRTDAQGRREPSLRHSRSHEPTPSQKEYQDGYFNDEDVPADAPRRHEGHRPPPIGPSFQPSDALPFAAQVARQPKRDITPRQDQRRDPRDRPHSPYDRGDRGDRNIRDDPRNSREYHESPRRHPQRPRSRARFDDRPQYDRRPDDRPPYDRRPHSRQPNDRLRPDPDGRPPNDRRQDFDGRPPPRDRPDVDGRPEFDERPHGRPRSEYEGRRGQDYDDRPRPNDGRHNRRPSFDDRDARRAEFNDRSRPPDFDDNRRGYNSPDRRPPSRGPPRRSQSNRRSGGGSDLEGPYSGPDERAPRQKHTRFADESPPERPVSRGVDGRRYVDEAPWR